MDVSAGTKSLKSVVRRLEVATVERQKKCAHCRLTREWFPPPKGPRIEPEEVITIRCQFCRAKLTVGLPVGFPLHSYILKECHSHTFEDSYTNRSFNAFCIWGAGMMNIVALQLAARRNEKEPRNRPRTRLRENLEKEACQLYLRTHEKLRAKYGTPFTEHTELVNSIVNRDRKHISQHFWLKGLENLYWQETEYLICAAMEKIIWGEVRPETNSSIETLGREIAEIVRAEEEGGPERRKEEARLKNLKELNKIRTEVGLPLLRDDYGKS